MDRLRDDNPRKIKTNLFVPTNEITQTINYNMRFLISDNRVNPIAWEVSKREDTFPTGITKITLKQSLFNPNTDNKELMIADYYKDKVLEENPEITKYQISYSGKSQIKAGGSYKTYSVPDIDFCFLENSKYSRGQISSYHTIQLQSNQNQDCKGLYLNRNSV